MHDGDRTEDGGLIQPRDDGQLHFAPGTAGYRLPGHRPGQCHPARGGRARRGHPAQPAVGDEGAAPRWGAPLRAPGPDPRPCGLGGDAVVYAIDDGAHHAMIGRRVGATADGCTYSLVARVDRATWEALEAGRIDGRQAFLTSADAGLSGTVDGDGLANVFDVDWYDSPADIPEEYLPPSPPSSTFAAGPSQPTAERRRPAAPTVRGQRSAVSRVPCTSRRARSGRRG